MAPRAMAIETTGLVRSYGDQRVLDGIDLAVDEGSIFALLGPNGSGKTTTVNVLSTLIARDAGDVRVAGHDPATEPDAVRAAIGVTGQFSAVDAFLTGEENLRLMADLHHLDRHRARRQVRELIERFHLVDVAGRTPATYSGGMVRRLDLAMTLVGSPRIVFLDEPTTGLDPRSRRATWDVVRELVVDGVTIFLTTQYLEEADVLADRIAVLDEGRIIAEGTSAELKALVPGGHVRVGFADEPAFAAARHALADASVEADAGALSLSVPSDGTPSRCAACWTVFRPQPWTSTASPSTPPIWTTCFWRSPGRPPAASAKPERRLPRDDASIHPAGRRHHDAARRPSRAA